MSQSTIQLVIGILIAILPFIGVPVAAEKSILVISGLSLIILSIVQFVRHRHGEPVPAEQVFVENRKEPDNQERSV
jgi:hypothetical protein